MFALIPARGGSKGLPGKNIKPFKGKPLIAYAIEAALSSKYIKKVFVSTDDELIRTTALQYGATDIGLRPAELAQDYSKAIDTYIYTIQLLSKIYGTNLENICILQPTSPLRTVDDIDSAIELFKLKNADSVVSYTEEHHPIVWHKYLNSDLSLSNIFPENIDNRQVNRVTVYPNGAVYVFKTELLFTGKYTSDKTYCYLMPRTRSIDIDTIDDFNYAEFLAGSHD
ncbi:acylneuraminate cytidylyltransferase family protein [Vibrio cholerae]